MSIRTIEDANNCLGLPMLCWVDYMPRTPACYVYPWLTVDDDEMCRINKGAFPNDGQMALHWSSSHRADSLREKYGELVVVTVNDEEMPKNTSFDGSRGSSMYRGKLDLSHQNSASRIQFARFSLHELSSKLIQVVRVIEKVDFSSPVETPLTLAEVVQLHTRLVMVQVDEYVFGPFQYHAREGNVITVSASPEFDNRIASLRLGRLDHSDVRNKQFNVVASFLTKHKVSACWPSARSSYLYDWLTDKDLLDIANRLISSAKNEMGLTKKQMRSLKAAFANPSGDAGQIQFDERRRQRLDDLFASFEFWHTSPEAVSHISETLTPRQLADIVLDENNFARFRRLILDDQSVQDRLEDEQEQLRKSYEEERALLADELDGMREQISIARTERDNAQAQAAEAQEQVDAVRQKREIRESVLQEKNGELDALVAQIEEKRKEADGLEALVASLNQQVGAARRTLDSVFHRVNEESVTSQIVQDEIVRRVVSTISEEKDSTAAPYSAHATVKVDEACEVASDDEVIEVLYKRIVEDTGRSYSRNDIINFLTCIAQGFITTFVGKPGTGKTSLCNIIGGALGLRHASQSCRFIEMAVEKGWDSYKDYIGYYNPLTKQHEKSDAEMYDALLMLDSEGRMDGPHAPLLVLLDEANLSPIEHYWAPFLHACDGFQRGIRLTLGGSENWTIPAWLRFLATVNFDHTTEELSPRFLDRSWIVTLDTDEADFDSVTQDPDCTGIAPISYERMMRIFGTKRVDKLDESVTEILDGIVDCFKGTRYPVSARSHSMVNRYLMTTCKLMETNAKDTEFIPLDYAVCQKVLPMMSAIPANQLQGLVEELLESCSKLPRATKKLEGIRDAGVANGFYQYFI